MTPLVSVLVVTWNGRAHLARCLPALAAQTLPDLEVVLVDNGSGDGSAELVARLLPAATLVRSPTNLGFVGGNRLGLPHCRGRHVALLNNDCVPEPTWLERAVEELERAGAGMAATTLCRADDPARIDSAGIALDRAAIAWDRGGGLATTSSECDLPPLFGPSGGGALYRRELLDDVPFFEPDFEMYYEDVDLAWRARLRGWDCVHAAAASALHVGSASGGRNSPRKRFLLGRNKLWTVARCYPGEGLRRYLAAIALYDAAALVAYAVLSRPGAVPPSARAAALRGRVAGLRGLPRQLWKRRAIQAGRTNPRGGLDALAPLAPPWRLMSRFKHLPEGAAF
ncbi:MAG TPA: glycosyltransferase family 2 protein [Chloroflexota bacterium]